MPGSSPLSAAFRDLMDDVAYHGGNLVQGAFDFVCLVALGALVYAGSVDGGEGGFALDPAAQASAAVSAPAARPAAACLALTEAAQVPDQGCITSQVLTSQLGT